MEAILFYLAWVVYIVLEAVRETLTKAPNLITNYLFIQGVLLLVRASWRRMHSHDKKKTRNVAAGVSSVSTGHMSGMHFYL